MTMSPRSRWGSKSAMTLSTTAVGTMSQTARGLARLLAKRMVRVIARPRRPRSARRARGRTTFAASGGSFELAIAPDQRAGRAVVLEPGLCRALELWNDALGEGL